MRGALAMATVPPFEALLERFAAERPDAPSIPEREDMLACLAYARRVVGHERMDPRITE